MKLSSVEPAMYGREDAGHSRVRTTNQPAETTNATAATPTCRRRVCSVVGAAMRYAAASAGATINPSSILARNAKPIATPAHASHLGLACCNARTVQYAAAVISSTITASGLLNRNINAATGVNASTAPASSPVRGPLMRATAPYSKATAATAINACGIIMLALLKPNICPDSPITHCETGGLSTVMKLCGSSEPNNNASQSFEPASAAAA